MFKYVEVKSSQRSHHPGTSISNSPQMIFLINPSIKSISNCTSKKTISNPWDILSTQLSHTKCPKFESQFRFRYCPKFPCICLCCVKKNAGTPGALPEIPAPVRRCDGGMEAVFNHQKWYVSNRHLSMIWRYNLLKSPTVLT